MLVKFRDIIILLLFLFAATAFFLPVSNPDLYWHLSAARYICAHLSLPHSDFLSWTMKGTEWLDFEWLSQLIIYFFYKAGGPGLLVIIKGLLFCAISLVSWRTALPACGGAALFLYFPFFAAAMLSSSDVRPENFSLFFFALLLYRLEIERLGGSSEFDLKTGFLTLLFFSLWTNLHAGYVYGLVLIAVYYLGEVISVWSVLGRENRAFRFAVLHNTNLKYLLIGLAASFINPYGWKIYSVMINHLRYMNVLSEHIQEWGRPVLSNSYQWPYFLLMGIAVTFFLVRFSRKKEIVWQHLGAVIFFGWASAGHSRHIPFFVMTALPFCTGFCGQDDFVGFSRRFKRIILLTAIFSGLYYYNRYIWPNYSGLSSNASRFSTGAAEFLKENKSRLKNLRMYNYWGWGGFLGYELHPDYKVFVDGRYIFHEKIAEVFTVGLEPEKWRDFVFKYGLELMVLKADTQTLPVRQILPNGKTESFQRPAFLFYLPKTDWAVIYWDSRAMVLVKRSAVSADYLKGTEYLYLRPNDLQNLLLPLAEGQISRSLVEKEIKMRLAAAARFEPGAEPPQEVEAFAQTVQNICGAKRSGCRK